MAKAQPPVAEASGASCQKRMRTPAMVEERKPVPPLKKGKAGDVAEVLEEIRALSLPMMSLPGPGFTAKSLASI